ncbi:MAG: roadblock/LC7 domain-containing protein [Candidatus Thorarchaeota archaeon]
MSTKIENLEQILNEVKRNCGVNASAIVTGRGQIIWSVLPQNIEEKALSAMAAALNSIAIRVVRELDAGQPKSLLLDGLNMSIILKGNDDLLIIGVAPYDSEISLISFELEKAMDRIQETMEGDS